MYFCSNIFSLMCLWNHFKRKKYIFSHKKCIGKGQKKIIKECLSFLGHLSYFFFLLSFLVADDDFLKPAAAISTTSISPAPANSTAFTMLGFSLSQSAHCSVKSSLKFWKKSAKLYHFKIPNFLMHKVWLFPVRELLLLLPSSLSIHWRALSLYEINHLMHERKIQLHKKEKENYQYVKTTICCNNHLESYIIPTFCISTFYLTETNRWQTKK